MKTSQIAPAQSAANHSRIAAAALRMPGLSCRDWEHTRNHRTTACLNVRVVIRAVLVTAALMVVGVLAWQGVMAAGNPDPVATHTSPTVAILDIGVLVFREGLECILVLSAIIASMVGDKESHRLPVIAGAGIAFIVTLITWFFAVGILSNLTGSVSALNLQAATGLLAVIVLLVIMNWFFHKIYWGGWMSLHNRRRKALLASATDPETSKTRILWDSDCSVSRRFIAKVSRWCCSCKVIICAWAARPCSAEPSWDSCSRAQLQRSPLWRIADCLIEKC